mgnify:CR=1 FL=1
MKKLILITILIPIISFSKTYYDSALNFQNEVRNYYDLKPFEYDSSLSLHAQEWADYMAQTDDFKVSTDNYGENIFYVEKIYCYSRNKNPYIEASMSWILDSDDLYSLNQIIYEHTKKVGFGFS